MTQRIARRLVLLFALFATGSGGLGAAEHARRLTDGWEHYQGSLGSTWEVWRGEAASDNVAWTPVTLPHCFNARDAVDPDVRYYQGPGWYRTRLAIDVPFPNGRTLVHFDGAGQRSQVFVGTELVGEHLGGYDEWTVDITEAAARVLAKESAKPRTSPAVWRSAASACCACLPRSA